MSEEKKALVVRQEEDGSRKILSYVTGEQAENVIGAASQAGVEVVKDAAQLDALIQGEERETQAEGEDTFEKLSFLVAEIEAFVSELDTAFIAGREPEAEPQEENSES